MEIPAQITDLRGQTVQPGDTIAAAFRDSTHAFLRVGKVVSFGERGNKLTVNVHWTRQSPGNSVDLVGAIDAELRRFVKLAGVA